MVRILFGALVLSVGLVALASVARGNLSANQEPVSTGGSRLRESETLAQGGISRTLFRPVPGLNIAFSLN